MAKSWRDRPEAQRDPVVEVDRAAGVRSTLRSLLRASPPVLGAFGGAVLGLAGGLVLVLFYLLVTRGYHGGPVFPYHVYDLPIHAATVLAGLFGLAFAPWPARTRLHGAAGWLVAYTLFVLLGCRFTVPSHQIALCERGHLFLVEGARQELAPGTTHYRHPLLWTVAYTGTEEGAAMLARWRERDRVYRERTERATEAYRQSLLHPADRGALPGGRSTTELRADIIDRDESRRLDAARSILRRRRAGSGGLDALGTSATTDRIDAMAAVDALGKLLRSANPSVRREAAWALTAEGSRAAPVLEDLEPGWNDLPRGPHGEVALAKAIGRRALPLVLAELRSPAPERATAAALTLPHLGSRLPEREVRRAGEVLAEALRGLRAHAAKARESESVAHALAMLGPVAIAEARDELDLLVAGGSGARYAACARVHLAPRSPAAEALVGGAARGGAPDAVVLRALGCLGPESVPSLRLLVRDWDEEAGRHAIDALDALGPVAADALPALEAAFASARGLDRSRLAEAIAAVAPDPERALAACARVRGDDVAAAVVAGWGRLGARRGVLPRPVIDALRRDQPAALNRAAISALARVGAPASAYVHQLLGEDAASSTVHPWVQQDIVRFALSRLGPEAVATLLERTRSPAAIDRERAIDGLARLDQAAPEVVQRLEELSEDVSAPRVQLLAAMALYRLTGVPDAPIRRIRAILGDERSSCFGAALTAAASLGSEDGAALVPALTAALARASVYEYARVRVALAQIDPWDPLALLAPPRAQK